MSIPNVLKSIIGLMQFFRICVVLCDVDKIIDINYNFESYQTNCGCFCSVLGILLDSVINCDYSSSKCKVQNSLRFVYQQKFKLENLV